MASGKRNDTEVIIGGKRYKLMGFESEEYLQKVAAFINNKIIELKSMESYKGMDSDMRSILLQINLADEYFKVRRRYEDSETDSDEKSSEIYQLKHDIMALKEKLEKAESEIERLKGDVIDEQKKNVRLETELDSERGKGANVVKMPRK